MPKKSRSTPNKLNKLGVVHSPLVLSLSFVRQRERRHLWSINSLTVPSLFPSCLLMITQWCSLLLRPLLFNSPGRCDVIQNHVPSSNFLCLRRTKGRAGILRHTCIHILSLCNVCFYLQLPNKMWQTTRLYYLWNILTKWFKNSCETL